MRRQGRIGTVLAATAALAISAEATATDFSDDLFWSSHTDDIPHVLTPVRLQQPTAEVPASVTVIDRDFIDAIGTSNVYELLRYVPGMLVAPEPLNNSVNVVYHGGPAILPRSMEVLIDGRAIYRSGISGVTWASLPVAVEDIQRIEIVRGPNSTAYGTNAYKAVINIITIHPSDTTGENKVSGYLGNTGYQYFQARSGFNLFGGDWRVTGVDRGTDNMEDSLDSEEFECSSRKCTDRRDSKFAHIRGYYDLGSSESLDLAFTIADGERQLPDYGLDSNIVKHGHTEVGARYLSQYNESHALKFSIYGSTYYRDQIQSQYEAISGVFDPEVGALYRANPEAAIKLENGEFPTALDLNDPVQASLAATLAARYANPEDFFTPASAVSEAHTTEERVDVEIQDTYAPSPNLTVLSGIGFRHDSVSSYDYYKGSVEQKTFRFFGNVNWRANNRWVLHSGAMVEITDEYKPAKSFRAAANYLLNPVESIRLVYSRAVRTPDFLEEYANWSYGIDKIETESPYATGDFYQSFIADGGLESESIVSYEIGYYGKSQAPLTPEWDIRLFHEIQNDVIYLFPSVLAEKVYSDNHIVYSGVEWQLSFAPRPRTSVRYTGAYLNASTSTEAGLSEGELITMFAPLSQTLAWNQKWSPALNSTVSLILVENLGEPISSQDSVDIYRINTTLYGYIKGSSDISVTWRISGQHNLSSDPYFPDGQTYEHAIQFQGGLGIEF